jgi:hypothetical protein
MTQEEPNPAAAVGELSAAAEAALLARLSEEGMDYEHDAVLLDFRRAAEPARRALLRRIANTRASPDPLDSLDTWLRFWQREVDLLATRALNAALTRRAEAETHSTVDMKEWRSLRAADAARHERQAALVAVQTEKRGVFKVAREYIDAAGHKVREMVAPDLLQAARRGDLTSDDPREWEDS